MESSLLVRPVAEAIFVKLPALREAVECEAAVELMLLVMGHGVSKGPSACGRGLEALITPAAVEVEIPDVGAANEGAAIRRHVHDAAPMAQQAQPGHEGKQ